MDFIDIGLFASYALIGFCALFAIGIPLVQSFGDPKSLLKSGLGVLGIVVIFLVSYGLADDTGDTTAATAKLVGAGLITTYFCFFAAIIGIVYTEISKIIS
jgi:hypothetical protein